MRPASGPLSFTGHIVLLLTLCTSLATTRAYSQNIVSRPVGFVRISLPSNTHMLAAQSFSAFGETNRSPILKWNPITGYTSSATMPEPGEGFWLLNQDSTNQDVFLMGEVVLTASNTALLHPGLNLVGYPYSSAVRLDETALGGMTDRVEILTACAKTPDERESALGKGYWVKSVSEECIVWTEVRPYENVFPESGLPEITAVTTKDGSSVAISIACEGDESFDIFYQDVDPTNRFDTTRNWKVAEAGVEARGRNKIEWLDRGSNDRAAPGQVPGRYFLIGRADIDVNGNGVPDAREQFAGGGNAMTEIAALGSVLAADSLGEAAEEAWLTQSTNREENAAMTNREPPQALSVGRVIYVDRNRGNDSFSGRAVVPAGGDGPKKTIRAGLSAAVEPGDVMVIRGGKYEESLNAAGRDIHIVIDGHVDLRGVSQPPAEDYLEPTSTTNAQTGANHD